MPEADVAAVCGHGDRGGREKPVAARGGWRDGTGCKEGCRSAGTPPCAIRPVRSAVVCGARRKTNPRQRLHGRMQRSSCPPVSKLNRLSSQFRRDPVPGGANSGSSSTCVERGNAERRMPHTSLSVYSLSKAVKEEMLASPPQVKHANEDRAWIRPFSPNRMKKPAEHFNFACPHHGFINIAERDLYQFR